MICPFCHGTGGHHEIIDAPVNGWKAKFARWIPCKECIGGIASCCDAAGSAQPDPFDRDEKASDGAKP